jgi:ADP-ribose pyrophosphatase YjhB (NUDIX family)
MTPEPVVAADRQELAVPLDGQVWMVSWHPPATPPDGTPHGAEGVCVTDEDEIVLISPDGERWGFPAGRPEGSESPEQTLHREMLEEACVAVVRARLLGFSRGVCTSEREEGLILVRSMWRTEVQLGAREPRFEIPHRQVVAATDVAVQVMLENNPFAPFIRRSMHEAGIAWETPVSEARQTP